MAGSPRCKIQDPTTYAAVYARPPRIGWIARPPRRLAPLLLAKNALLLVREALQLTRIVALKEAHVHLDELDPARLELLDGASLVRARQAIVIVCLELPEYVLGLARQHVVDPELGGRGMGGVFRDGHVEVGDGG